MKKLLSIVLLLPFGFAFSQKVANPAPYAKTITAADLKKHLYIVAGPEMEGRETGTPGIRKAANYIINEFKRIGLQPAGVNGSWEQPYNLYQDSLANAKLEVNGIAFQLDKDFNVNLNNIPAMYAFSEAVYIGPKVSADSIKNANLNGKLVIIQSEGNQNARMQALAGKSPGALLVVSTNYPRTTPAARLGRLSLNFFQRSMGLQTFNISENVARAIAGNTFEALKAGTTTKVVPAKVLLDVQKATKIVESSNVLGMVPGTDLKDEYLFITAHYDHEGARGDSVIFYGADDDGSGTVSVIEIAEAFAKAKAEGKGPRRSVVFMTVSGEEKGLLGSDYYGSNPIYPLAKTTANLNIDMIGRIDPKRTNGDSTNYIYIIGDNKISSDLNPISVAANKNVKLELDYKYNDLNDPNRFYYRSDHYNFAKHGVPIIFYFNGTHADYHRPTDTPDKINYPLMAKRAQLIFYTAWEMANRAQMLKRDLELPTLSR